VTGATSFLLTLFLLPRLGIIGAATAPFLATLLQSYLVVRQSQKLYPVPHRWPPLVLAAGLACLPVTLAFIAPTSSPAVLMLKLSVDALILLFLARLLKIPVELRTWLSAVHRPSL
jgi:purine-cytosine permease-like protein